MLMSHHTNDSKMQSMLHAAARLTRRFPLAPLRSRRLRLHMVSADAVIAPQSQLDQLIAQSGLKGDPTRFTPRGPEAKPGTLHALPTHVAEPFDTPVAIVVLDVAGGWATVCPTVVPPATTASVLLGDLFLPSDESPLRGLPGTGVLQIRTALKVVVPTSALGPAVRVIDLSKLRAQDPDARISGTLDDEQAWHDAWGSAAEALWPGAGRSGLLEA